MNRRIAARTAMLAAVAAAGLLGGCGREPEDTPKTRGTKCLNNLRQVDVVKEQLRLKNNMSKGQRTQPEDIDELLPKDSRYLFYKDGIIACPEGGTYTYGRIGEHPKCSIHGELR